VHQKTDAATNTRAAVPIRRPSAIRVELDQQRRFRIEQLQELTADAAEAIATADDPRLQVTRVLKLAAESALAEIEGALRRLEQGTYGTCERCSQPIPWERLEVLPMTGLCTLCQWMAESDGATAPRSRTSARDRIR
jgi:RNA polymerase-binding transcription factor DksA